MMATLCSVGMNCFTLWKPSRGQTSMISTFWGRKGSKAMSDRSFFPEGLQVPAGQAEKFTEHFLVVLTEGR